MAKLIHGERIAATGQLYPGAAGVLFDAARKRMLLTQRTDNGRWCLPGGRMEAGESVREVCEREFWEETGLRVQVLRLVGVYSNPNIVVEYADGNRWQYVSLCFEVKLLEGEMQLSNETTAVGYFTGEEIAEMDVMETHRVRIEDAFTGQLAAFVR